MKWDVVVDLTLSLVIEAEDEDEAERIVSAPDYPLDALVLQRIENGDYDIESIWTLGETP